MIDLSVADYNRLEEVGMTELPVSAIWCFRPAHFQETGFPTTVSRELELYRFMDSMAGGDIEQIVSYYLKGGLTNTEFVAFQKLVRLALQFNQSRFHKAQLARASVARGFNVLRHIQFLYGQDRPRVLEIGPGSGFLGALLIQEGYPYGATDVTQGFYLFQSHLWNYLTSGALREGAWEDVSDLNPTAEHPVHIPWWKFAKLTPSHAPEFDVITCNHVLCEMHNWSMRFVVAIAVHLLKASTRPKFFVFENWGEQSVMTSQGYVEEAFRKFGFVRVWQDELIHVLASPATAQTHDLNKFVQAIQIGREKQQPERINGTAAIEGFAKDLLGTTPQKTDEEEFINFIGGAEHAYPLYCEMWPVINSKRLPELENAYQQLCQVVSNLYTEINALKQASAQGTRPLFR